MINTGIGNETVIDTILQVMRRVEGRPKATHYDPAKVSVPS
jgi:hypothetical protein